MFGLEEQLERLRDLTWETVEADPQWERHVRAYVHFYSTIMMSDVNSGTDVRGCSLSWRGRYCRLCLRATVDGIPQVAFITAQTPTDCVVILCSQWLEDRIKWYEDKYA